MKTKSTLLIGLILTTSLSYASEKFRVAIDTTGFPWTIETSSVQKLLEEKGYEVVDASQSPDFTFSYYRQYVADSFFWRCTVFTDFWDKNQRPSFGSAGTARIKSNQNEAACRKALAKAELKVLSEKELRDAISLSSIK